MPRRSPSSVISGPWPDRRHSPRSELCSNWSWLSKTNYCKIGVFPELSGGLANAVDDEVDNLMENIAIKDFLQFKFLESLRLSPDGRYAAFVKRDCDEDGDAYPASLWRVDTASGELLQLRAPEKEGVLFAWDGGKILLAASGRSGGGDTAILEIDPETGDTAPAFTVPLPVRGIEPAGGGAYALTVQRDLRPPEDREENGADWYALDELPFSANGPGYATSLRRNALYRFTPGEKPVRLTADWYHVEGCTVNSALQKAVCWGQSYRGVRSIRPGLAVVDFATGDFRELIPPDVWRVEHADFLGNKVMMCATKGERYNISENPNFYLVDMDTGSVTEYCQVDVMAKGLGTASDCRFGGGYDCMVRDGRIYFTACEKENCELWEIPAQGVLRKATQGNGSVDCFDIRGGEIWFVGMRGQGLQELCRLDRETGQETCHTGFNSGYMAEHQIGEPEECAFVNDNGDWVQGWVLRPAGYVEGRKYPAILDIHGGPKVAYGRVFYHEMQFWASRGYFVFFCNPRGSDGRGNAYGMLIGSYGTYDYDDIMAFTDVVLERYPDIDPRRVGVTGGSYGGFMTNWIVTHTDRFAAAATQRSISSWTLHEGACDSGYWVIPHMHPPTSRVNPLAWEQSPLRYAGNIKTPLLIIHSDHDMRCHTGEALCLYTALIGRGVPLRMCLFKDENHELSRRGRPQSRVKRLEEITAWMDRYLKEEA